MIGSRMTGLLFGAASLKQHGTCNLEGHFGGIDVVDLAVGDGSLDANHREAGEDAGFHGFLHTSIDGRNEFLW